VTGGTTMWPRQKILSKFNDERCDLGELRWHAPTVLI
jgi:hypothetical protein